MIGRVPLRQRAAAVSAFFATLTNSATAAVMLGLLGFSSFFQTLIGAANLAALQALLGIGYNTKELLSNPDWLIDQINEGAAYTVNGASVQAMDAWSGLATGAGVFTMQQVADPDYPNQKALKIVVTTADNSIAAGDRYVVNTAIDGQDAAELALGTVNASSFTVQFDAKFPVAGTYGISFRNSANNRNYVGTFTQNVANARESKTVTVSGDTTGTWLYSLNSIGLRMDICLAAGSTYQTSAGVWANTPGMLTTSAQANFMATLSNTGYIGRISLKKGSVVQAFGMMDRDRDLAKCQKKYWKSFPQGVAVATNAGRAGEIALNVRTAGAVVSDNTLYFPKMDGVPTMTFYNPSAANNFARNQTAGTDATTTAAVNPGDNQSHYSFTGLAGWAANDVISVHATANCRLL